MGYDRNAAVNYADAHWNIPCDDGVIWLSNTSISVRNKRVELNAPAADGWEAFFVSDHPTFPEKAVFRRTVGAVLEEKIIQGWAGLADCAHFLSRALSKGGLVPEIKERGVRELVETLQKRGDTKTLCERVAKDRAQRVIDTGIFKKGDMIGYFNIDPQGDFHRIGYSHSTMYVGKIDAAHKGGVTCHTVARFPPRSWENDSWWLHDGYTYTLIHVVDNDDSPKDLLRARALEGWWKLDYLGRTEYYQILKDGKAKYTKKAPKSATDPIHPVEGTAFWFMDVGGKITFFWRSTGTVEVWSPSVGITGGYSSMINGVTPGTVSKVF